MLTDWGAWASIDAIIKYARERRCGGGGGSVGSHTTVAYWNLLLMQLIFSIPYFFGAIAKMNEDWLGRAQQKRAVSPICGARRHSDSVFSPYVSGSILLTGARSRYSYGSPQVCVCLMDLPIPT